jgi:hypothetical protein
VLFYCNWLWGKTPTVFDLRKFSERALEKSRFGPFRGRFEVILLLFLQYCIPFYIFLAKSVNMNAKPLVKVEGGTSIAPKAALKIIQRFSKAAQASIDMQGLDLTNSERSSSVSQDVLEQLTKIETALRDELEWISDRNKFSANGESPIKKEQPNNISESVSTEKSSKQKKRRKLSETLDSR